MEADVANPDGNRRSPSKMARQDRSVDLKIRYAMITAERRGRFFGVGERRGFMYKKSRNPSSAIKINARDKKKIRFVDTP